MAGVVCSAAAGEADTPERHQQSRLTCIKRTNWVVVVVCVGAAEKLRQSAVSDNNQIGVGSVMHATLYLLAYDNLRQYSTREFMCTASYDH